MDQERKEKAAIKRIADMLRKEIADILSKYEPKGRWVRYDVPYSAFDYNDDTRILGCFQNRIENYYLYFGQKVVVQSLNEARKFVIVKENTMSEHTVEFGVNIPYEERSKYISAIYDINNLVGDDGTAILAVDNIPYCLESLLVISTTIDMLSEIEKVLLKYKLKRDNTIDINSLLANCKDRKFNIQYLPRNMPLEMFSDIVLSMYYFSEKSELLSSGYSLKRKEKKKIFISYSHADKEIVHNIVDKIEERGLNVWIDKKKIDVGDRILDAVNQGMQECDLPVIFISENTLTASFAQHELKSFFASVISNEKKWFIVRLDNVDPRRISYGLNDFLYYDYDPDKIDELIDKLITKLEKC